MPALATCSVSGAGPGRAPLKITSSGVETVSPRSHVLSASTCSRAVAKFVSDVVSSVVPAIASQSAPAAATAAMPVPVAPTVMSPVRAAARSPSSVLKAVAPQALPVSPTTLPVTTIVGTGPGRKARSRPVLVSPWVVVNAFPRKSKRRDCRPLPSISTRARNASVSLPVLVEPEIQSRPPWASSPPDVVLGSPTASSTAPVPPNAGSRSPVSESP